MNIGLMGFGGVGQELIKLLAEKRDYLSNKYKLDIKVKYIVKSDGGIYNSEGIDLEEVIEIIDNNTSIKNYKLWNYKVDIDYILKNNDIDTIVELTSTNIETGEPGLTHIRKAINNKINVVTGNKGPILLNYKELKSLANNNNVKLKVGCTTGGALPSINGGIYDVAGSEIIFIEGILNGTTNYILSKMMNDEVSYEEALKEAQEYGIAEKNPSLDVLGYDTASKIIILSNVLMETEMNINHIEVQGITNINLEQLKLLKKQNKKLKLIGKVERKDLKVDVYVKLIEIGEDHPLYCVDYKNKGIYFKTDTLGDISLIGGASGTKNAAASILRDILLIKGC